METNEPHPIALSSVGGLLDLTITTTYVPGPFDFLPFPKIRMQIYGCLIAILLGPDLPEAASRPSHLIVWDWISGSEIAHIKLNRRRKYQFGFLSQKYLVVLQPAAPYDTIGFSAIYNTLGHLDVFQLPTSNEAGPQSNRPIARFMLPDLDEDKIELSAHLNTEFVSTPVDWKLPPDRSPMIYDSTTGSHLLCINISVIGRDQHAQGNSGALFVQSRALINTLFEQCHTNQAQIYNLISIPWETWGPHTFWLSTPTGQFSSSNPGWGLRAMVIERIYPSISLSALDFNPHRLKAQEFTRRAAGVEERDSQDDKVPVTDASGRQNTLSKTFRASSVVTQHMKTKMKMRDPPPGVLESAMISAEHGESEYGHSPSQVQRSCRLSMQYWLNFER
ncbi:hypothetical protein CTheo_2379 [Ceratobasidium theobromae]|uniref:Uncharacterized protein n=1 Tax=Ceratobasidium theobromae TaxID=1582974 RepID=A0A5N5QRH4_9AGAM|nr:hypothetical protein CTheo_2379 [Ceratobasidium theobromae]